MDIETWIAELSYVESDADPRITRLIDAGEVAVEPLMDALDSGRYWDDYVVRTEACYILGEIGDARATPTLIRALRDWDQRHVWPQAVGALKKIGHPAYEALLPGLHDADERQLLLCLHALGEFGNRDAISAIEPFLNDLRGIIQLCAAECLCRLGDCRSVSRIIAALSSDDQVQMTFAIFSLVRLAPDLATHPRLKESAIISLSALAGNDDSITRSSAGYALARLREAG